MLVDALLQGRIKGPQLVEQIHEAELGVPVIVLTVPQNPIEPDPATGIHGVLSMPFSGFDLMTRIARRRKEFDETPGRSRRHGVMTRVRAEGRRRQDDHRVQPRRGARRSSGSEPC